ncbi:MAG: ACP S-malonyltransferase [Oscillospiraceae bacterium]|nr:ACP S-malonyltransferase [Oscillospiraceae bacterium]
MGRDLYEAYPAFRAVFDSAPVDFDLKSLCFEGPEERLNRTRYTQPCLLAFAIGVTRLLYDRGIRPQAAAGLSLGEYSALYAAGVLDEKTAIKTVSLRGRAMEEAAGNLSCGMTAVLGLEREKLESACREAAALGTVQVCNYNCPGQLVISGGKTAVDRAGELAKELGAKRCMPLRVSGPFHTALMAPAGEALAAHFRTTALRPMDFPVYFNCKGGPMAPGETIPELLVRQVQSGVLWEDTIRAMERDGVNTVVEIGPGKTLSGFFRKTAPGIRTYSIETAADLEKVAAGWKGA